MKRKKNTYLILIVLFLFSLLSFYPVSGAETETVYSTKDAHVYSKNPNNNYGDWSEMYCGNWNDGDYTYQDEIFLYFDLSSINQGWEKVELYLTIISVPNDLDFKICESDGSWSESSITWNNRPSHGSHLRTITITKDAIWKLEVTSHVSSSEFSICIYAEYNQWGTVLIRSKEYSAISNRPKLVFSYSATSPNDDTPPDDGFSWEIDKTGTVERIIDGDTLETTEETIRLADINTPEVGEPGADEATAYLSSLVNNKEIYIDVDDIYGVGSFGRTIAVLYVYYNETHLINVNKALLVGGYALISNYYNEFNPYDWTLYVVYQSNPDPDPTPLVPPDMKDRGSIYSDFSPYQVSPGSSYFEISCSIENIGKSSSGSFSVYFYASNDSIISTDDFIIGSDSVVSIEADDYYDSDFSSIFPFNIPDGSYYIGWIIDPFDSIDELNEDNNVAFISSQQLLVDGTPPSSSASYTPKSGSDKIDISTTFSLSASDNLGSGVSSIFYKINSGRWKEYTEDFTLKNYEKGEHTIYYYSIDNLNNTGEINEIIVEKIDFRYIEVSIRISIVIVIITIIAIY